MCALIFRNIWPKMAEGGAMLTPNELVPLCYFGENRQKNTTVRERRYRQTHTETRIYNLSHAICYLYGGSTNLA